MSPTSTTTVYTLRCEPPGGTTPDPVAACARLLTGPSLFAPRPAHLLCPMIMESAARASVTGTYFGKQVHVTIVEGGCDLSRWAKLKRVFG
jgi:Subtilisin inhibitor-like